MLCGQSWFKNQRQAIIEKRECPAPGIFCSYNPVIPDAPQIMALGSTLTWLGHEVHKSHHLAYRNGMLFCLRCASHSIYKVRNLALPCRMKPLHPIDRRRLKYMLEGRSPTGEEMRANLEHSVPDYLRHFVDEDESDLTTLNPSDQGMRGTPSSTTVPAVLHSDGTGARPSDE